MANISLHSILNEMVGNLTTGSNTVVNEGVADTIAYVRDKASAAGDYLGDKAESAAEYVDDKLDRVGDFVGDKLERAGEFIQAEPGYAIGIPAALAAGAGALALRRKLAAQKLAAQNRA